MPWLIKKTAHLDNLRPEIARLEPDICEAYTEMGGVAVVTSANDSVHRTGSLHYQNLAVDLRAHQFGTKRQLVLLNILKRRLGAKYPGQYDLILEGIGTENAHVHLEASDSLLAKLGVQKGVGS